MSDKVKIGALWKKTTQSGKELLAGNVVIDGKKTQIAVFVNGYKEAPAQPDYVIYLDAYKPTPKQTPAEDAAPASQSADDDIPF